MDMEKSAFDKQMFHGPLRLWDTERNFNGFC